MADIPVNEKLYAMVVGQAKAKYRVYPSPGASHWVHRRYLELGGKFEDSTERARREMLMDRAKKRIEERRRHGDDKDPRRIAHDDKKHEDKK
jgi:hypothetical protein